MTSATHATYRMSIYIVDAYNVDVCLVYECKYGRGHENTNDAICIFFRTYVKATKCSGVPIPIEVTSSLVLDLDRAYSMHNIIETMHMLSITEYHRQIEHY